MSLAQREDCKRLLSILHILAEARPADRAHAVEGGLCGAPVWAGALGSLSAQRSSQQLQRPPAAQHTCSALRHVYEEIFPRLRHCS